LNYTYQKFIIEIVCMSPLPPIKLGQLHWYHWLIVVMSLLLTLSAWHITKQQNEDKIRLLFDRQVEQATSLIIERMQKYEDALWAGVALVQVTGKEISREQWRTYYNNLDIDTKYPGINGVGIIHNIPQEKLTSYLATQRASLADFHIHPKHQIPDLWPITYIEPQAKNAAAVGLDMAHENNRYTAALKARDTGLAQITGPIVLVQDEGKTAGFLFYAPFYQGGHQETLETRQERIGGLVYAPFVVKKLMQGTLNQDNRHIGIRISDKDEIIYDENQTEDPYFDKNSTLEARVTSEMYGRQWQFYIRSNLLGKEFSANNQPMIILVAGILIDTLLLSLFLVLARSNKKTTAYAAEVTKDLESMFLSNMSHELRTPLNAVTGFITICLKTKLTEKQSDYLEKAKLASSTLLSLINHTLDYSKIESGKLEIDKVEFSLFDLLHKIHAIFSIQASNKDINFWVELPPSFPSLILGDPLRIEQILLNLCANSFKFTTQGEIKIIVNFSMKNDDVIAVDFMVTDTGIGITEEQITYLFESFKQADSSTTREYGGTGLGLTICKQLAKLMGGDITVESEINVGSRFCVSLDFTVANRELKTSNSKVEKGFKPLQQDSLNLEEIVELNQKSAKSRDETEVIESETVKPLANLKLLLVEDIAMNQIIAQAILEENGAIVCLANDGVEALELLEKNSDYDLILMDIQMPRMDGYETTKNILNNKKFCHIPVVAMTANAVLSDVEKCLNAGMKGHIAKPLEEQDILKKIAEGLC